MLLWSVFSAVVLLDGYFGLFKSNLGQIRCGLLGFKKRRENKKQTLLSPHPTTRMKNHSGCLEVRRGAPDGTRASGICLLPPQETSIEVTTYGTGPSLNHDSKCVAQGMIVPLIAALVKRFNAFTAVVRASTTR